MLISFAVYICCQVYLALRTTKSATAAETTNCKVEAMIIAAKIMVVVKYSLLSKENVFWNHGGGQIQFTFKGKPIVSCCSINIIISWNPDGGQIQFALKGKHILKPEQSAGATQHAQYPHWWVLLPCCGKFLLQRPHIFGFDIFIDLFLPLDLIFCERHNS